MDPEELYRQNAERLKQLAHRALSRGFRNTDIMIVCIEVDSAWRWLVDVLMPGTDWQPIRDRGETPVARGSVG